MAGTDPYSSLPIFTDTGKYVEVHNDTASDLKAEVSLSSGSSIEVLQDTFADLKATVIGNGSAGTPDAGVLTIQGITSMTPIVVNNSTAANLKAEVTVASGQTIEVTQDTASSLKAEVVQASGEVFDVNVVSEAGANPSVDVFEFEDIAAAGTASHTYTNSTGNPQSLKLVTLSSAERFKLMISVGTVASEVLQKTVFGEGYTAAQVECFAIEVLNGKAVKLDIKNKGKDTASFYATIELE